MPNVKSSAASATPTLIASSLGFVLVILDVTVVNVALERIQASFGASVTGLQWVVNAYTLVFASLLLTAGALSDRFGAKRTFVAGVALFTVASAGCGAASGTVMLVMARVVQGVGAAFCLPSSLALLKISFPDATARAKAVGLWASAGGVAVAAGPVAGGLLVDRLGWPSIFFLNLPLGALAIWLALAYAPSAPRIKGRHLDLSGQALAILALAGLTVAFVESGSLGWTHPLIITSFIVFGIAGVAFLILEHNGDDPMLPLSVFHSAWVSVPCLVGLLTNFAFYGLMFVLSLFFQTVKGYSPLQTGLAFLPMTILITIGNLIAGALTARFGPRIPLIAGQATAALGYLALAGIAVATPYIEIAGPLLIAGFGASLTVPSMTTAVLAHVHESRAGIASGALNAVRQIGGVVGVGAFGSLVAGAAGIPIGGMHAALLLAGGAQVVGCLACVLVLRSAKAVTEFGSTTTET
jgi:DHA2 family methylenomycin A resistance protein-like MFS transporter